MEVHIISLKEIPEKLDYLNRQGVKPILFKGVDGKTAQYELLTEYFEPKMINIIPNSLMGCAISHMKLWEELLKSNKDYYIIFEDDTIVSDDFLVKLDDALKNVPHDYDILYLGCFGCQNKSLLQNIHYMLGIVRKEEIINDKIKIPKVAMGNHAYIISRNGAEKLIKALKGKLHTHLDYEINRLTEIKRYSLHENIARQTSGDSTESSNISGNHPIIISHFAKDIFLEKDMSLNYGLNFSSIKFFGICFNLISFLFLLLGIILAYKKYSLNYFILSFILLSSIDIVTLQNIKVMIFHFMLLILPSLIVKFFSF